MVSPGLVSLQHTYRNQTTMSDWWNMLNNQGIHTVDKDTEELALAWVEHAIETHELAANDASITVVITSEGWFRAYIDPDWAAACIHFPTYQNGEVWTTDFLIVIPDKTVKKYTKKSLYKIVMHELAHVEETMNHGVSADFTDRFQRYLDILGAPQYSDDLK